MPLIIKGQTTTIIGSEGIFRKHENPEIVRDVLVEPVKDHMNIHGTVVPPGPKSRYRVSRDEALNLINSGLVVAVDEKPAAKAPETAPSDDEVDAKDTIDDGDDEPAAPDAGEPEAASAPVRRRPAAKPRKKR